MSCNSCSMYNRISRRKLNPMAAMVRKVSRETGLKGKALFVKASKELYKMKSPKKSGKMSRKRSHKKRSHKRSRK